MQNGKQKFCPSFNKSLTMSGICTELKANLLFFKEEDEGTRFKKVSGLIWISKLEEVCKSLKGVKENKKLIFVLFLSFVLEFGQDLYLR